MIKDYSKKIEDITTDYYSTIGKFNNVTHLLELKNYEILESDSEETKKIKEGMQREILVDLGRVAEMALKYIIKIKRIELYPDEPYYDIKKDGMTTKGFKDRGKITADVVKDLGSKVQASKEDIESILNVTGIGPKAHDFYYLYQIVQKFMPEIMTKLDKFTEMLVKSINIRDICSKSDIEYLHFIAFPNKAYEYKTSDTTKEEEKEIIELINQRNITIANNGDIFTRLRYYSNNPFDKKFDIYEIYGAILFIIEFIKTIHLQNENLNFDPEIAFSFYTMINNTKSTRFEDVEIKQIYENIKISSNYDSLVNCFFYSDLSFDEIIELLNSYEIDEKDYPDIFIKSLNLETIRYFRQIGIADYEEMGYMLERKTITPQIRLNNAVEKKLYNLKEYKQLVKKYKAENNLKVLNLLNLMSEDMLDVLINYPDTLDFFTNEFSQNVDKISYNYNMKIFKSLLNIEQLQQNPNAWYGLDTDQLLIYKTVAIALLNDEINFDLVNKSSLYLDTIIENIKENIEQFKENQKLLCIMPLMLDSEENKNKLDILVNNGLDIENLRGFDSTILCFPLKLVELIEKLFKLNKIPLIINNQINPLSIFIIGMIQKNHQMDINIQKRRIPFYKTKETIKNSNPIIEELTYSENIEIELTKEMVAQFKNIKYSLDLLTKPKDDLNEKTFYST